MGKTNIILHLLISQSCGVHAECCCCVNVASSFFCLIFISSFFPLERRQLKFRSRDHNKTATEMRERNRFRQSKLSASGHTVSLDGETHILTKAHTFQRHRREKREKEITGKRGKPITISLFIFSSGIFTNKKQNRRSKIDAKNRQQKTYDYFQSFENIHHFS